MITIGQLYWFFPKDQLFSYAEHVDKRDLWIGPWLCLRSEEGWQETADADGDLIQDLQPNRVECEAYVTHDVIEITRISFK